MAPPFQLFVEDDCNIYVQSEAAGERVMRSVVAFLEGKLRLKVNEQKSAVAPVWERSFLGHRLLPERALGIAPKSLSRAKERLRRITRPQPGDRARAYGLGSKQLHHGLGDLLSPCGLQERAQGARRMASSQAPLRTPQAVQTPQTDRRLPDEARRAGVAAVAAGVIGKGWWRLSGSPPANEAMTLQWFKATGLVSFSTYHAALQPAENRRVR
jgi:RNA-directed DNA polymerase